SKDAGKRYDEQGDPRELDPGRGAPPVARFQAKKQGTDRGQAHNRRPNSLEPLQQRAFPSQGSLRRQLLLDALHLRSAQMIDSDWRGGVRWAGAADRGAAPRTGAGPFRYWGGGGAERGPRGGGGGRRRAAA